MLMKFFENFTIVKKRACYSINYKDVHLCSVKINALKKLIIDYASNNFIDSILAKGSKTKPPRHIYAEQLEHLYTSERRKFYRAKYISRITPNDRTFPHFIKAVEIIKRYDCSNKEFLQAQVDGLKFIGKQYPNPSHLSTAGAETRLIEYLYKKNNSTTIGARDKIELTEKDIYTPLNENIAFINRWEKLQEGTATLVEAQYLQDCYLQRKGFSSKKIKAYIEKLEDTDE